MLFLQWLKNSSSMVFKKKSRAEVCVMEQRGSHLWKTSFHHFDERPGQTYRSFGCSIIKRDKNPCRFVVFISMLNLQRMCSTVEENEFIQCIIYKRFYTEALIAKAQFSSASICHIHNRK